MRWSGSAKASGCSITTVACIMWHSALQDHRHGHPGLCWSAPLPVLAPTWRVLKYINLFYSISQLWCSWKHHQPQHYREAPVGTATNLWKSSTSSGWCSHQWRLCHPSISAHHKKLGYHWNGQFFGTLSKSITDSICHFTTTLIPWQKQSSSTARDSDRITVPTL